MENFKDHYRHSLISFLKLKPENFHIISYQHLRNIENLLDFHILFFKICLFYIYCPSSRPYHSLWCIYPGHSNQSLDSLFLNSSNVSSSAVSLCCTHNGCLYTYPSLTVHIVTLGKITDWVSSKYLCSRLCNSIFWLNEYMMMDSCIDCYLSIWMTIQHVGPFCKPTLEIIFGQCGMWWLPIVHKFLPW